MTQKPEDREGEGAVNIVDSLALSIADTRHNGGSLRDLMLTLADYSGLPWDEVAFMENLRALARANLTVLRVPSPAMIERMVEDTGVIGCCTHDEKTALETWQIGIDAALHSESQSS